jgi:hypothetical protein
MRRRIAATLAGLALVLIPSTIAMSSASSTATTSSQQNLSPVYYQQMQQSRQGRGFHRGRHCHRKDGSQQQSGGGAPDV